MQRAVEEVGLLPLSWRAASTNSDWGMVLTAERAQELVAAIEAVIDRASEDEDDPQARRFVVQLQTFPGPGKITPEVGSG